MKILFRVDSSIGVGTGHVMRCLTLAKRLVRNKADCVFLCKALPGSMIEHVKDEGFEVHEIDANCEQKASLNEQDAHASLSILDEKYPEATWDWLVVDHYDLDIQFEQALRQRIKRILVIDDLADRNHDCDLLLDQNYYEDMHERYVGRVPLHCELLLGPSHALLREEFSRFAGTRTLNRSDPIKRILISFGGSDPERQTMAAIAAAKASSVGGNVNLDVVVGSSNPELERIQNEFAQDRQVIVHIQTQDMARLMENSDLCIGAGGTSVWERCLVGLPTIAVATAENQARTLMDLAQLGVIEYLGCSSQVSASTYITAIESMVSDPVKRLFMADTGIRLMSASSSGVEELMLALC